MTRTTIFTEEVSSMERRMVSELSVIAVTQCTTVFSKTILGTEWEYMKAAMAISTVANMRGAIVMVKESLSTRTFLRMRVLGTKESATEKGQKNAVKPNSKLSKEKRWKRT